MTAAEVYSSHESRFTLDKLSMQNWTNSEGLPFLKTERYTGITFEMDFPLMVVSCLSVLHLPKQLRLAQDLRQADDVRTVRFAKNKTGLFGKTDGIDNG